MRRRVLAVKKRIIPTIPLKETATVSVNSYSIEIIGIDAKQTTINAYSYYGKPNCFVFFPREIIYEPGVTYSIKFDLGYMRMNDTCGQFSIARYGDNSYPVIPSKSFSNELDTCNAFVDFQYNASMDAIVITRAYIIDYYDMTTKNF